MNYSQWINEAESKLDTSEKFIENVKIALSGINYKVVSSDRQIKNGTLEIVINDEKAIKEVMSERHLNDSDFESSSRREEFFNKWVGKSDKLPTHALHYIIYKIGTWRRYGASSIGGKFETDTLDNIKSGLNSLKRNYTDTVQHDLVNYLNKNKFLKFTKGYSISVEQLKEFKERGLLSSTAYDILLKMRSNRLEMYDMLCPHIAFLLFLANLNNDMIVSSYGSDIIDPTPYQKMHMERAKNDPDFMYDNLDFTIKKPTEIRVRPFMDWKIPRNYDAEIKYIGKVEWYVPDNPIRHGYKPLSQVLNSDFIKKLLPDSAGKIAKILSKPNDFNFDQLTDRFRGSIAGHRFNL